MDITAPRFTNEDKAREHLEALRWPEGPFCPHCGSFKAKRLPPVRGKPSKAHPEGKVRSGIIQCNDCREQYSVTVGTVFESSKVPLHKWVLVNHLMCASKKGISAHQVHRMIGVTYKTAWFMCHRLREAMRNDTPPSMGSGGGAVEVDETFIGRKKDKPVAGAYHHKMAVLGLVDRETGRSRLIHLEKAAGSIIQPIVLANLAREARLMTDENTLYRKIGRQFAEHGAVKHYNKEYVRGDITTNTVEGAFSIFKRGMKGIYQHCAEKHLHRYLAEFEFRYSNRQAVGVNDAGRADVVLGSIYGRRLTYRRAAI
jgi:transposase-like protein